MLLWADGSEVTDASLASETIPCPNDACCEGVVEGVMEGPEHAGEFGMSSTRWWGLRTCEVCDGEGVVAI
jgi:hypothetical protein